MTARVIPLLACSFCGSLVENLPDDVLVIAGRGDVYICASCVHVCVDIIEREKNPRPPQAATPRTTGRRKRADRQERGADPS